MNATPNIHTAHLSELILCEAFPFHLVVSETGEIVSCGESLKKNPSLDLSGHYFFDNFIVQHPLDVREVSHLTNELKSFFLLASKSNSDLVLRGQLVIDKNSGTFVFLVSPWVTELDKLDSLGFDLSDFPVHSPLSDFLILLQAQRISLNDSLRLSEELAVLNRDLEGRVARRTAALESKAHELMESKSTLESEMKERERVEIELRHAQKLESVGQLAAGIAHEINTPMQYIGNSLSFLKSSFNDMKLINDSLETCTNSSSQETESALRNLQNLLNEVDFTYIVNRAPKALDRALDGIDRVTSIVRAMNEFTHPDATEMDQADLNRALDTVLTVAKNEYKYAADIKRDFGLLPLVNCYQGDLNQVFLNLIVNSAHAIADRGQTRGLITLKTRVQKNSVLVSISDNGSGIPEEIQHRIFDLFFTTKEVGRGTGQGLAISHKIITEKHRGKLTFETRLDIGTTFHIELPLSETSEFSSTGTHGADEKFLDEKYTVCR